MRDKIMDMAEMLLRKARSNGSHNAPADYASSAPLTNPTDDYIQMLGAILKMGGGAALMADMDAPGVVVGAPMFGTGLASGALAGNRIMGRQFGYHPQQRMMDREMQERAKREGLR